MTTTASARAKQIPFGNDKQEGREAGRMAGMPRREYHFWVYILASRSRTLYVGMTNSLVRRTATHREGVPGTFSGRYAIHRLVYYEFFQYVSNAIGREKELKHWTREQKVELIERVNPTWEDLYPTLAEMGTAMPTVGAVPNGRQVK